jgi:hypothetical protein
MDDISTIKDLNNKIKNIDERLIALEREQRKIIEDILSGQASERIRKRILERPRERFPEKKKKIEKFRIEI